MAVRKAHLVGSLPGPTPAAAMTTALEILGPYLRTLPDGETGDRRNWIIPIIESLREHPDLELRKPGDWSDYDKTPVLKIRKGRTLYGANLDFGHVTAVRESFPQFERAEPRPDDPISLSRKAFRAISTWPCSLWARPPRCVIGARSPRRP